MPITNLSSKSHDINITWNNNSSAKITLSNPADYAGNRDFILDYKLTGNQVESGLVLAEGESENFFMLTIQPPERFTPEDIPPREYIFVLDVSGSMNGYPMDTAKVLIKDLVSSLKETDKFNLILFSGSSEQLSPKSLTATRENIKEAIDLIDEQEGYGGTSLSPALESAINIPADKNTARSIVVITDGYISGEQNVFDLISQNLGTTSFFSFGIGSSVNRYLVDGIAYAGTGESFVVTDAEDASKTAERFRTYIQSPILTDINVTYEGFDVYDVEPAALPTLFAQKPIVLFGKYKGDAEGTIMTPYTSFIAVIDTIRNPEGKSADVDQPNPLPLGVSNLAVGGGYRAYSEPAEIILLLSMICILLASMIYHYRKKRIKKCIS